MILRLALCLGLSPVSFQYVKARVDIVVESHDATFQIMQGEIIFGYQPLATKEPKVFENLEDFVIDRGMFHSLRKIVLTMKKEIDEIAKTKGINWQRDEGGMLSKSSSKKVTTTPTISTLPPFPSSLDLSP
ncbi:hypothetical protein L1887_06414 [Cichorium endivia]|nr:hypothetical protein L1887_06414 [Cichorium endivia]